MNCGALSCSKNSRNPWEMGSKSFQNGARTNLVLGPLRDLKQLLKEDVCWCLMMSVDVCWCLLMFVDVYFILHCFIYTQTKGPIANTNWNQSANEEKENHRLAPIAMVIWIYMEFTWQWKSTCKCIKAGNSGRIYNAVRKCVAGFDDPIADRERIWMRPIWKFTETKFEIALSSFMAWTLLGSEGICRRRIYKTYNIEAELITSRQEVKTVTRLSWNSEVLLKFVGVWSRWSNPCKSAVFLRPVNLMEANLPKKPYQWVWVAVGKFH